MCRIRIVFKDFDDDTDKLPGSTLHVPILHEDVTDAPHSVQMTGVFCVVFDQNIGLHVIVQELGRLFQRRIYERPDTHEQETVESSGHTIAHHLTHRAAVLEQILAQLIEVRSGAWEVNAHEPFDTHVFKNIDNHRGIIMEKIFERD